MISLSIPFKFKDRDVGYALINRLASMEKGQPNAFWSAISAISDEFEILNGKIGEGTVLGKPPSHESINMNPKTNRHQAIQRKTALHGRIPPKFTDIDQFMAMRFRDRELGQQIVLTLIEIESRDESTFKTLCRNILDLSNGKR